MAYTTTTLVAQQLSRTLTADEIAYLTLLIPAIDRWIDKKTDSHYDTVAETSRVYSGGVQELDIDPVQSITAIVSIDSSGNVVTTYTSDQYAFYPANQDITRSISLRHAKFSRGISDIKVTGKFTEYDFANGEVPKDIQIIATRIASAIVNSNSATTSTPAGVKAESIEGHSITYGDAGASTIDSIAETDPLVISFLNARRKLYVG